MEEDKSDINLEEKVNKSTPVEIVDVLANYKDPEDVKYNLKTIDKDEFKVISWVDLVQW
jgi:hypothetical protein